MNTNVTTIPEPLRFETDANLLRRAAARKNATIETLVAVGANPNCPPDVIYKLSGHADVSVVSAVARNPSCTKAAFHNVLDGGLMRAVRLMMLNPNCPADIVALLLDTLPATELKKIGGRIELSAALGTILSRHPDEIVRRGVVWNIALPSECLNLMAFDTDYTVREAARTRLMLRENQAA